jgi:hypothetical protein
MSQAGWSKPNHNSTFTIFSELFMKEAKEEGGAGKEVATEAVKKKA